MGLSFRQRWHFTSSGGGIPVNSNGQGNQWTGYYSTDGASTIAVNLQAAPLSGGPFGTIPGTSTRADTGMTVIVQFTGPQLWIRPYVTSMVGTSCTIEVIAIES